MNTYMMAFCCALVSLFNILSFSMDRSPLPKDLIILIGICDDEARDVLFKTCKSVYQKLSMNSSSLIHLINHPSFHTNAKNMQRLAFNAAWNENTELLKSMMKHMTESDYAYQYEIDGGLKVKLGLKSIVELKLPRKYNEIKEEAAKYNGTSHFHSFGTADDLVQQCSELTMACYNKNEQKIHELSERNDVGFGDWERMAFIGIDKNSDKCINALSPYIREKRFLMDDEDSLLDDCLQYEIFLKVAIKNNKDKAFTAIAENDFFYCLNYIHSNNESVLDLLEYEVEKMKIAHGQKYIDIYRECGGKNWNELKSYAEPCGMQ